MAMPMQWGNDRTKKLMELKKKVESSYTWFETNAQRFNEFMRFVFDTSLTQDDIQKLMSLKKPTIECNILEAMISRLIGEFGKHEPSIVVKAADAMKVQNFTPDYLELMKFIESHIRHEITDCTNDGLQERLYQDVLGGGYSVAKVFTDYISNHTFDQKIRVERVYDPTMCGFDPLARESHKGDGQYAYELYPMSLDDFKAKFGEDAVKGMKMSRAIGPYNLTWSFAQKEQETVMVCEFYEKHIKKAKLVKLSDGRIMLKKWYKKHLLPAWEQMGYIQQPPAIVDERLTEVETIGRYHFCETAVLDYAETDFRYFPLVFIDGNSVEIRDTVNNSCSQMTRPYCFHAKGIQQLFNFAAQTVGQEMENIPQQQWIVSVEAVPKDFMEAYRNPQAGSTLLYNQFDPNDPSIRLDAPREVQRRATPQIVENIFNGSNRIMQNILGSYDAVMGVSDKDISGVAINNGAIQSSAASAPYLMGYIRGLNRIAQIMLDLIPKYYVTPRSMPTMANDGKRGYQLINKEGDENSLKVHYRSEDLDIKVEAGVNTSIQKQAAVDQIIRMMQASEDFANFINSMGLDTILDNLEIRGIEDIKAKAAQYMQMKQEQQKKQAEEAAQGDPMQKMLEAQTQVEMARIDQKREEAEGNLAIKAAQVSVEQEKADTQRAIALNEVEDKKARTVLEGQKVIAELSRSAVELAIDKTRESQQHGKRE